MEYDDLTITKENTYNYESNNSNKLFKTKNYLNEIKKINKEFIILKQFWTVYKFEKIVDNINSLILPSKRLIDIYNTIKTKTIGINQNYNFIHYRYENDFINFFKVKVDDLKTIIIKLKPKFKNPNLKIFIATSNIIKLIDLLDTDLCDLILTKDEHCDELKSLNFEEKAFIDYMFGLHSTEIYGHSKSSFSHMLNNLKNTLNYYD